ncbi:MAG TPA: hypothetical protein VFV38_14210 [Ktedonobacteraceae bacterium]|nr:hypothetical protein [Ktedonobacteraceae bacterium]
MTTSEIVRFRGQQTQQEEAAHSGLSGLAIVSRHDFIEARAERGAARILQLLAQGHHEEAERQMNLPDWGLEEGEKQPMSHFDTASRCERN